MNKFFHATYNFFYQTTYIMSTNRIKQVLTKKIIKRWHDGTQLTSEGHNIKRYVPIDNWTRFEDVFRALCQYTRCGRYVQNCITLDDWQLTSTGKKMKRWLNRNNDQNLKRGYRPLLEFLIENTDAQLKTLFGRKFLNVRSMPRALTGYNLFIRDYGFEGASQAWKSLGDEMKHQYNTLATEKNEIPSVDNKPLRRTQNNSWILAVREWNRRRNQRLFVPIRRGSTEYEEIKKIQQSL